MNLINPHPSGILQERLFLVALATTKRISELQALRKKVGFTKEDVVCCFTVGFLAKSETPSFPWPRSFTIKYLTDILDPTDQERALCPVRALKYYLERTKSIRGTSPNLWFQLRIQTVLYPILQAEFIPLCNFAVHFLEVQISVCEFLSA